MNDQQSTTRITGASQGSDFQPPTQNPQSNVNSSLQTTGTGTGLQTATPDLLNSQQSIIVPAADGTTITVAPTNESVLASRTVTPKHSPVVAWVGAGIVVLLLGVMAIGILRPRKY